MIIGITGTLGAGKGTASSYLMKRGFKHFSVREFLIKELIRRGFETNRDNLVAVANELRARHGASYIAEALYEEARASGENAIIESLRTVGEVEALLSKGNFVLLAIDADTRERYRRISERASETDKISFDEFVNNEEREMHNTDPTKQNIGACMKLADAVLLNNSGVEEFEQALEQTLNHLGTDTTKKRVDAISWEDYFMGLALLSGKRSKDPNTQVGACIVNTDKTIVGIGYNGFPKGCSDDEYPWTREGDFLNTKYPYVVHAELNAILNSIGHDLRGCSMYVALFPCNECAKAIIQSGIKHLVYLDDKYADTDQVKASKRMFDSAGVTHTKMIPEKKSILLDF